MWAGADVSSLVIHNRRKLAMILTWENLCDFFLHGEILI